MEPPHRADHRDDDNANDVLSEWRVDAEPTQEKGGKDVDVQRHRDRIGEHQGEVGRPLMTCGSVGDCARGKERLHVANVETDDRAHGVGKSTHADHGNHGVGPHGSIQNRHDHEKAAAEDRGKWGRSGFAEILAVT